MIRKILVRIMGLVEFGIRVFRRCGRDRIAESSAQGAFFILMSVFPFTMLLLHLMKFAPISQESLLLAVDSLFPIYLLPIIHEILQEIYSSSFGLVTVSIVTTLWASSKTIHALQKGLGRICNEDEVKNWFVVRAWALLYTFLVAIIMVIAVAMVVVWQKLQDILYHYRPRGISLSVYSSVMQAMYTVLLLTLAFAVMYKVFPHKKLRFRDQFPGALAAALACYGFSVFVTVYVSDFNGFSMYGSLTTLTLVMFWLYFSNYFFMVGAEINDVLRRDREKDRALESIGISK